MKSLKRSEDRKYVKAVARKLLRETKDVQFLYGDECFIRVNLKVGQIRRLAKYILEAE